jgi:hypothetical protein
MGSIRNLPALSLEERNFAEVGTFQPSFGFKDFHQAARPRPPRRWSPKTVTTRSMVGRSEPGCDLSPALSFKDLHHPCWGGGQAEPEIYLPRGFVGQPLLQHSRERALTGLAGGADFDNAGPIGGERRQLQRVGLAAQPALAWLSVPPLAARPVGAPRASEDRPRRRALLGRRSCSRAVLPLPRYGASARRSVLRSSGRIRVGICRWADGSCRRCRGGGGWRSPRRRRDHRHHPRSGPPALCTCPRPSSVDVGEGIVAAASAPRPSLLQFGHPERRSLSLLLERAAAGDQGPCRPAGPPMWRVVRTHGGGTGVPFVMAP